MKTEFYLHTAYRLSEMPVPNCFLKLDEHFDIHLEPRIPREGGTHVALLLAESICARMADVEMYAYLIDDTRRRQRIGHDGDAKVAILTRPFLMGYLGSARALLDSSAATLATLYDLALERPYRTFGSAEFWQQFVTRAPNPYRRYHPMRIFFAEVLRWTNETVDRVPPLEAMRALFGQYSTREAHLKILDEGAVDLGQLPEERRPLAWIDPLTLHDRWKPQFLSLCEKLCTEIANSVTMREP
jgi:hypothetical protein